MKCSPRAPAGKYEPAVHELRLNAHPRAPAKVPPPSLSPSPALQHQALALALSSTLKSKDRELRARFESGTAVEELLQARAHCVDQLVAQVWQAQFADFGSPPALAAVGGYGRGELHPHSDVDLLILLPDGERRAYQTAIEQFIACLWDAGLRASHSVRMVSECLTAARDDVTVATNLMEARLLIGPPQLFAELQTGMSPDKIWPAAEFLQAKRREQAARHAKYQDAVGQLEPNVKESPGGLRDIQTITWTAKRCFGADCSAELIASGFLNAAEYQTLRNGETFLWRIRFALHLLYGRHEERLLVDAQPRLARQLGYQDENGLPAVEKFMQDYYRTVKELGLLNEILLQSLEENLSRNRSPVITPLTAEFEVRDGLLCQRTPSLFQKRPAALLELFSLWQQHPRLKGIGAATLRALRANLNRIDEKFRADDGNRALFMQLLRAPAGVTHTLRRMNRYGVLAHYLPAFGAIVGRMQYDLFHAYTVDEHTLFVISNLRRFALSRYDHEFPFCSQIMQALAKPELAYLAALFHDIAKGRGGDHSELGAEEAEQFSLAHGLSRYDSLLVAWLVRQHLLLSVTAQKRDIHDREVIRAFVHLVGDQLHLDYLYVLTVADVRGTNPELWNSWKAGLFSELYLEASCALRQGQETPIEKDELIREVQTQARQILQTNGADPGTIQSAWEAFTEDYFLHHNADEIAWHTQCLNRLPKASMSGVFVRTQSLRGGTAIALRSGSDHTLFERVSAALAELGLTILDARLTPLRDGNRLDAYIVLEDNHDPITNAERLEEIEQCLRHELGRRHAAPITVTRRAPRQVRMFATPIEVHFGADPNRRHTVMEISAGDRPGLLSLIGEVLRNHNIRLQNAKITTVGERAEDVFFITNTAMQPITDTIADNLRAALLARLGESN